jgi:hypothetical protein
MMSWSQLSDKKTKRIASITGLDVIRAWSRGSYKHEFVTADHRHGWFDLKTSEFGLHDEDSLTVSHFTSCEDLFPGTNKAALEALRRK